MGVVSRAPEPRLLVRMTPKGPEVIQPVAAARWKSQNRLHGAKAPRVGERAAKFLRRVAVTVRDRGLDTTFRELVESWSRKTHREKGRYRRVWSPELRPRA